MKNALAVVLSFMSCAAFAQDILILGEVHDNPAHHQIQAEKIRDFAPRAVVWEMLTPAQADGEVLQKINDPVALADDLDWSESGWPDFDLYHPVFAAAPEARVYGAGLPRAAAMTAMEQGSAQFFGQDAAAYGLDRDLPEAEQAVREALQFSAHCDALPESMLPGMVEIQRLRDARLARVTVRALSETGGPVAVITGNGHARKDWGVPSYLARVVPDAEIYVIGQTEDDLPLEGGFDLVLSSASIDRPDPCEAFAK